MRATLMIFGGLVLTIFGYGFFGCASIDPPDQHEFALKALFMFVGNLGSALLYYARD